MGHGVRHAFCYPDPRRTGPFPKEETGGRRRAVLPVVSVRSTVLRSRRACRVVFLRFDTPMNRVGKDLATKERGRVESATQREGEKTGCERIRRRKEIPREETGRICRPIPYIWPFSRLSLSFGNSPNPPSSRNLRTRRPFRPHRLYLYCIAIRPVLRASSPWIPDAFGQLTTDVALYQVAFRQDFYGRFQESADCFARGRFRGRKPNGFGEIKPVVNLRGRVLPRRPGIASLWPPANYLILEIVFPRTFAILAHTSPHVSHAPLCFLYVVEAVLLSNHLREIF